MGSAVMPMQTEGCYHYCCTADLITYSLMMINGCDTIININNPLVEV